MLPVAAALIIVSTLFVVLDIAPLLWHIESRNWTICSLIIWIILLNIFTIINAAIWGQGTPKTSWWLGYGLCDVEVKLTQAAYLGITGGLACTMRRLANIVDKNKITLVPTKAQKTRDLLFTIIMCYFFPVYIMIAQYVVQTYRYGIVGVTGCTVLLDLSLLSELLVRIWPIVLSLVAVYYSSKLLEYV